MHADPHIHVSQLRQADILAYCRQCLMTEEIIAILSAITSRMKHEDPVCIALDKCNDTLMDMQEAERIGALWEQDDKDCKGMDAPQFDVFAPRSSIPSFLTKEAA